MSTINFKKVWCCLREERFFLAEKLLIELKKHNKKYYEIALSINLKDGINMKEELLEEYNNDICEQKSCHSMQNLDILDELDVFRRDINFSENEENKSNSSSD